MKKLLLLSFFTFTFSLFTDLCQAQYSVLLNFNGTNGANPMGSLLALGNNLYGMTSGGGYYGYGCLFCFNTSTQVYTDLLDFNGRNGANPQGSLISGGKKLYGMTQYGGAHGKGIIFSIDTDGSNYFDIVDLNAISGYNPYGSLLLIGSKLYGMTDSTGSGGYYGLIFSIDTDASRWKSLTYFNGTYGADPYGSLLFSGGKLYGMTSGGGRLANQDGIIFSVDTGDSGFTDIYDFNYLNDGSTPFGSLIQSGNNFFGMTSSGQFGGGCIFKIQTDSASFHVLYEFPSGSISNPNADLSISGNRLFGMAPNGGTFNKGVIFSIYKDLADTDTLALPDLSDTYSLYDSIGANPYGSLTALGGSLYGMTSKGGTDNEGVIFRIDTGFITSINEVKTFSAAINVYPNPGTGIFTLTIGNFIPGTRDIEIYNTASEKIYAGTFDSPGNKCLINLTGEPDGVYFFRILTEDRKLIGEGKLVIQK